MTCAVQTIPELAAANAKDSCAQMSVEGFEAATSFMGVKPGFAFKRGDAGLGYYPDPLQRK